MANLETIELTINGSAESAKNGIDVLIASLSSLSEAIVKPYSDLRDLAAVLKEIKSASSGISFSGFSRAVSAVKTGTAAKGAVKKAASATEAVKGGYIGEPLNKPIKTEEEYQRELAANIQANKTRLATIRENNKLFRARIQQEKVNKSFAEAWKKQDVANAGEKAAKSARDQMDIYGQQAKVLMDNAKAADLMALKHESMRQSIIDDARAGKLTNAQLVDRILQLRKYEDTMNEANSASKGTVSALSALKGGIKSAFSGLENAYSRVKRIATSMLIRSAIRGLIKGIKEGMTNVREWAKVNNKELYNSLEGIKIKTGQVKNTLGAALVPMITSLIPIINALSSALMTAVNWLNQFFALLGGQGSWTHATEGAEGFTDAAKGAGGAAKEWLASWDELNVMSSSGGGGGGGAAADFNNMFEQLTQFDDQIREIVEFIQKNMESIKDMAIATGIAIASWKLGNAFMDILPILSTIFGYVSTGAAIAVTLQADWILMNQYLDTGKEGWLWAAMLSTAVGSIAAAAIASKLIGGSAGYYAAAITLALSAITDIKANVDHTDVSAFSKESILSNIKGAIEAGGAVGVILAAGGASAGAIALAFAGAAVATFAIATVLKLATQGNTVVEWGNVALTQAQIDSWVRSSGQFFTVDPKVVINLVSENVTEGEIQREQIRQTIEKLIGDMNVIKLGLATSETYNQVMSGVESLVADIQKYAENAKQTGKLTLQFTPMLVGDDGTGQAQWYNSYETGWNIVSDYFATKGKELADCFVENEKGEIELRNPELLQTIMAGLNEVTSAITESQIVSDAVSDMRLGLGDVTEATGKQVIEAFKSYKTQLTSAYEDLVKEQYKKQGELVAALGKIDPNSPEYIEALAEYKRMGERLNDAVKEGVDSNITPAEEMIKEWLGGIKFTADMSSAEWTNLIDNFGGVLTAAVDEVVNAATGDPYVLEAAKLIGLTGWDLLEEESRKSLVKALGGLFDSETMLKLKQELNVKASDLIQISGYEQFTLKEKLFFMNALAEVFGASEVKEAAKNYGINLTELVEQGMESKEPSIVGEAKKLNRLIGDEIEQPHPVQVESPKTNVIQSIANKIKETAKKIIETPNTLNVSTNPSQIANIQSTITNTVSANRQVNATMSSSSIEKIKQQLIGAASSIPVSLSISNLEVFKNTVKKAIGNIMVALKLPGFASGGVASSGQIFVARENGIPEMVGRIGNTTAVANNDMIVEGIASGVAAANAEQNALLRQQNELLMGILQKSGNIQIGASSALGRVVNQSLQMYGAMTGA